MAGATNVNLEEAALLTPTAFRDKWNRLFANNEFENIDEAAFRDFKEDILQTFASWREVSANHLRGGTHTKRTLFERDAILPYRRIINMSCIVANPVTAAELAAGVVKPKATYQLVQGSGTPTPVLVDGEATGQVVYEPYPAYLDETSTTAVQAHWVLTSGSEADRIRSYPVYRNDFPYKKGDPIQYTFPSGSNQGVTLLHEALHDMSGVNNPVPTGLTTDQHWKSFAPLAPITHTQNSDLGTNNDMFEVGRGELVDAAGNYYRGILINKSEGLGKGFLGARVQNDQGEPVFELVQCREYVNGSATNVFEPLGSTQVDLSDYVLTTDPRLNAVREHLLEFNPGVQQATIRASVARKVGTYSVVSESNLTGTVFLRNGTVVNPPVALIINEVLEVETTAGTGGGSLLFDIA